MLQRLVVLNYHRVPEQPDSMQPDQVDRQVFREQLRAFSRFFNVVDLAEGIDAMRSNQLPSRAVAITFDDGYRDNHDVALEELDRANLTATFFIATDYLDGGRMWNDTIVESLRRTQKTQVAPTELGLSSDALGPSLSLESSHDRLKAMEALIPQVKYLEAQERLETVERIAHVCGVEPPDDLMMSSQQIKTLFEAGMGIGGHTSSHPILLRLPIDDASNDIQKGRDALTHITGVAPRFFAYPNGKLNQDFNYEHTKLLPTLGFDAAFSTQWGYATAELPAFELPRVGFGRNVGIKLALKTLRSYFDSPQEFAKSA